jgi:hypothetical protein
MNLLPNLSRNLVSHTFQREKKIKNASFLSPVCEPLDAVTLFGFGRRNGVPSEPFEQPDLI